MDVLLLIFGGLAVVGLIVFAFHQYERARTQRFEALAVEMSLEFHPKGDGRVTALMGELRLFNQGHRRRTHNMLIGRTDDVDIAIFGYRYTTGSGKHQHTHSQTVISFQSPHLSLPKFELRPEHMFHKLGQAFGYQDIDFESHPDFSKRYLLRGPDEQSIREAFTPDVLDFFESKKGISVEAANDRLVFFRSGKRIKPEQVRTFMEEGFEVYTRLKQS